MILKEYYLNPGELIFSKKPVIIKTVLGSCVAVCIYDKLNGYGGMCHFLLPESMENGLTTKYGNIAIKLLINKFLKAGSEKKFLEASIVGGAFIIFGEKEIFFIGDRNIEVATNIINRNKIHIKSADTGGERGKRVVFNTLTNQLIVREFQQKNLDDLYNYEFSVSQSD